MFGDGTHVTWSFDSDMGAGPIGRYFGLLMDRMVGPDFEGGLANLKALAEKVRAVLTQVMVERRYKRFLNSSGQHP